MLVGSYGGAVYMSDHGPALSAGPIIKALEYASGDHFFFDKAQKFELEPLPPKTMLEAYTKIFETSEPFGEETLLKLAQMSRGIFRRFLRYILLTLDTWEVQRPARPPIDMEMVKKAVPLVRLAEDMDLELIGLFPKHSDLRFKAVQLLMHLQEQGIRKRSDLSEFLNIEPYALSRLITKLEQGNYIKRKRDGMENFIALRAAME
jgi:hypothetical protein